MYSMSRHSTLCDVNHARTLSAAIPVSDSHPYIRSITLAACIYKQLFTFISTCHSLSPTSCSSCSSSTLSYKMVATTRLETLLVLVMFSVVLMANKCSAQNCYATLLQPCANTSYDCGEEQISCAKRNACISVRKTGGIEGTVQLNMCVLSGCEISIHTLLISEILFYFEFYILRYIRHPFNPFCLRSLYLHQRTRLGNEQYLVVPTAVKNT